MTKTRQEVVPKVADKPTNPDRIDDKWRPPASVSEPTENAETYITGRKIGKGGFAVCFEGRVTATSEVFALKVVRARVQQKKMMEKFRTEMQIHAKMRHPNIVDFKRAFTLGDHTFVVLELCCNGSLTDMVKARGSLSLPEVRRYMIQICGGVKYMHKRSVIHRDLKMGNIFIDSQMNLKIGDFGLAAVMADEQDRRTTLCGTPNYIAPEILSKSGTRGHDFKVDTWAVGVIVYAMLTGTPPFQSKTQQEIYSKLKGLDYEWKHDGINHIPQEAKNLVTSCLTLDAAERPGMDDLVEQNFFKMGAIADDLDMACLRSSPSWLVNADPRGDKVKTGYGIDHGSLCAQCGVGRLLSGKSRPAVGGRANISALVEIEIENRQGTAPTTPLPEGVLYRQMTDSEETLTSALRKPVTSIPRSRKPVDQRSLSSNLRAAQTDITSKERAPSRSGQMLPPPLPTQSFAAQQRQQALPRKPVAPSGIMAPDAPQPLTTVSCDEMPAVAQGLLQARPVRSTRARSNRSHTSQTDMATKPVVTTIKLDDLSSRLMKETDETEVRPSALEPERTAIGQPQLRQASTLVQHNSTSFAVSQVSIAASTIKPLGTSTLNARNATVKRHSPRAEENENTDPASMTDCRLLKTKPPFKPRLISLSEPYNLVPETSHADVLSSLRRLHGLLDQNYTDHRHLKSVTSLTKPAVSHPRVDKWVDYATKHGIAYILTDGSLGMILKSKMAEATSSSCIVVRNAQRHTIRRAHGDEQQFVPQGRNVPDIEFYEQTDAASAMKRLDLPAKEFELDLSRYADQSHAAHALLRKLRGSAAHRMKEIGLLDKFGRYMNKQMGTSDLVEQTPGGKCRGSLIHFYQRMGNVGVWRFVDGGLQFNFPDHTKLVVYQATDIEDVLVDVVCLEAHDARDLAKQGMLTSDGLERRTLRTFSLDDIGKGRLSSQDAEIVQSNEIKQKLSWVRAVIGCWLKEGGLGQTGSDNRLGWRGLQEVRTDKKVKLQWITVGRPAGDDEAVSTTHEQCSMEQS